MTWYVYKHTVTRLVCVCVHVYTCTCIGTLFCTSGPIFTESPISSSRHSSELLTPEMTARLIQLTSLNS